ncbi:hypothetical protein BO78DRAFT_149701 [Aspergillus sclerotiicarbonarius CBS 121057]|uniref:Uncharacterized protein n=1 Tax=Aspergillus sclerotiicarbonarius (strain CBS 121057 / IBT 28362) TaxID=1448318 RepID=A0A319E7B6_ASPSB|nr:hypothetical protein BO78DRAFT_149701 [Aspergillus sclerotiicarbonarius CBS 121057]
MLQTLYHNTGGWLWDPRSSAVTLAGFRSVNTSPSHPAGREGQREGLEGSSKGTRNAPPVEKTTHGKLNKERTDNQNPLHVRRIRQRATIRGTSEHRTQQHNTGYEGGAKRDDRASETGKLGNGDPHGLLVVLKRKPTRTQMQCLPPKKEKQQTRHV